MNGKIFQLRKGVKYREEDFGGLIFDPSRAMILEINCDGLKIIEKLSSGCDVDIFLDADDQLNERILSFFNVLQKLNLVEEVA